MTTAEKISIFLGTAGLTVALIPLLLSLLRSRRAAKKFEDEQLVKDISMFKKAARSRVARYDLNLYLNLMIAKQRDTATALRSERNMIFAMLLAAGGIFTYLYISGEITDMVFVGISIFAMTTLLGMFLWFAYEISSVDDYVEKFERRIMDIWRYHINMEMNRADTADSTNPGKVTRPELV